MSNYDIIMIGSSGQAKEVLELLKENIENGLQWNILGYISPDKGNLDNTIHYLGDDNFLLNYEKEVNIVIAIGDGKVRNLIVDKFRGKHNILFPNIISINTILSNSSVLGIGNIIQQGVILSAEAKLGNFNLINIGSSISHETEIGNFSTICPGVHVAGNVKVGNNTFIGIGSSIIQGIKIGNNSLIGSGTTVIRDVKDNEVVVGCPGRVIKNLK